MSEGEARCIELRIHGVGGSTGEAMLGSSPSPRSTASSTGPTTRLWRRNDGTGVEAYDWGDLSSSSPRQALWILLLPFTLANVAGHMAPVGLPRATPTVVRAHSLVVRALGVCLTFSWAAWLSVALVDLIGLQWFRRVGAIEAVADFFDRSQQENALLFGRVGVAVGLLATVLALLALHRLAGRSLVHTQATAVGAASPGSPLGHPDFFRDSSGRTLACFHIGAVLLVLIVVARAMLLLDERSRFEGHSDIGGVVLMAWSFQALLIGTLLVFALIWGRDGLLRRVVEGSVSAAALACVLTNAFFASLLFFLAKNLQRWPRFSDAPPMRYGQEQTLTDVWLQSLVLTGVVVAALVVWIHRNAPVDLAPTMRAGPPDGPSRFGGLATDLARRAQRAAAVGHSAPWLIGVIGMVTYPLGLIAAAQRVTPYGWNPARARLDFGDKAWMNAAAIVLPVGLTATIVFVRRAALSSPTRRAVGVLWDVLTFWPRDHHPLAVRCSSAQIVPEIRERLEAAADKDACFIVSAHSQGSVLAYAALSGLHPDQLGRVSLVTYGSPLTTIYERMFPAHFGSTHHEELFTRLSPNGRWRNFYRLTDPIGGPVDPANLLTNEAVPLDRCLDDPATGPLLVEPSDEALFEPPRTTWGEVAGHSRYLAEREVQTWITDIRRRTRVVP